MRFGIGGGSRWARGGVSFGRGGVRGGVGSGPFSISGGTSRSRSQSEGSGEWLFVTFLAARWVGKGLWDATFSEDADARDSPDSLETKFAAFGRLIDRDKARIRLAKQPQSPLSAAYRKSPLLRKASALPLLRFVLPAHVGFMVVLADANYVLAILFFQLT